MPRSLPIGYSEKRLNWPSDNVNLNQVVSVGSGFTISRKGVVVTNDHVVNKCKKIFVVYQGKPKAAELLHTDPSVDLAIVSIPVSTPSFFYFKNGSPELGEELISGGFSIARKLWFWNKDQHRGCV